MSTLRTNNLESLETGRVLEVDALVESQEVSEALLDRVISVTRISDLLAISSPYTDAFVYVSNYHAGVPGGSGLFRWDATANKASHNGGTVIDPDVTFPSDWTNATQINTWFTAGTGSGCWVRLVTAPGVLDVRWFGAFSDYSTDDILALQQTVDVDQAIPDELEIFIGRHKTTKPLIIYSKTILVGSGGSAFIEKNVAGILDNVPANTNSPTGDGTDSWDKDATILVYHEDVEWATSWAIRGISLVNLGAEVGETTYCIYAPRAYRFKLSDIVFYRATFGIMGHNWFMFEMDMIISYFNTTRYGISLEESDGGYAEATTGKINRYWGNGGGRLRLTGASSTTISNCDIEKQVNGAYIFTDCELSLINCASEQGDVLGGVGAVKATRSIITITGYNIFALPTNNISALIYLEDNSVATIIDTHTKDPNGVINYSVICRSGSIAKLINSEIDSNNGVLVDGGGNSVTIENGQKRGIITTSGRSSLPVCGTSADVAPQGFLETGLRGVLSGTTVTVTNDLSVVAGIYELTGGLIRVKFYSRTSGAEVTTGTYDVAWTASLRDIE